MTDKQLQVIERDMLFVKEPGTGPNVHYRINQPNAFGNYEHIVERRQKFVRPNNGDQLVFNELFNLTDYGGTINMLFQ